jgi:uncharacterized NAD(P)/FAD-binding protein YdhS
MLPKEEQEAMMRDRKRQWKTEKSKGTFNRTVMENLNVDISIIGAGFSGTLVLANLVKETQGNCSIAIIDHLESFNKGIAYNPSSSMFLLNVATKRMSAFPEDPDHFLNWVCKQNEFELFSREALANSFLPRDIYRQYLSSIWSETLSLAKSKNIQVECIYSFAKNIFTTDEIYLIETENGETIRTKQLVLATGNQTPSNRILKNKLEVTHPRYFQNPWKHEAINNFESDLNILIVGNGLTMVDTTLGLVENHFQNKIYAVSPNGFNVIPHLHNNIAYSIDLNLEDPEFSLTHLLRKVNAEVKKLSQLGITSEPVVDALRSKTQEIWKKLTVDEKRSFMRHLRHIWGVSRHRIAPHVYRKIQNLRINKKLAVIAGEIHKISDQGTHLEVTLFNKKSKKIKTIKVSRIINCTGPQTNLKESENQLLHKLFMEGFLSQDELNLGTRIDLSTYEIINSTNQVVPCFFTLGVNLKGELWESVAVPELKVQAKEVAHQMVARLQTQEHAHKENLENVQEEVK